MSSTDGQTKKKNVRNVDSEAPAQPSSSGPKKQPRIRLRKKNKNYHLLLAAAAIANAGSDDHTTRQEVSPEEKFENFNKNNLNNNINLSQAPKKQLKKKIHENSLNLPKQNNCESEGVIEMQPLKVETTLANGMATNNVDKTREQIMAEREAKKMAKQQSKKQKNVDPTKAGSEPKESIKEQTNPVKSETSQQIDLKPVANEQIKAGMAEKSRDQIKMEREAKKQAKQLAKAAKSGAADTAIATSVAVATQQMSALKIDAEGQSMEAQHEPTAAEKKKPALSKAERRAIQEAQRAAKTQAQTQKSKPPSTEKALPKKPATAVSAPVGTAAPTLKKTGSPPPAKSVKFSDCKVKLFNHLESSHKDVSLFVNNPSIHPSITRLGEQYAKRTIVGSNARCIAFLKALKLVIQDFNTPPKKLFARSLETNINTCVEHLHNCRPLAVSVTNAHKHIKHVLTQLPTDKPESELKENLCHFIDTYIENQIGKAAEAISSSMQEKITNGDVILTFGCSSLINYICEEAQRRKVDFRVIIVDSRPFCEGQELLRRLTSKEIPCTYVLINALGFVMPEATKVILGAHALLSNGYVMARTGTAQVALVARSFNVPVLVCCETHKFSERFQTDAIVYNELGNPDDLILSDKCCLTNWQAKNRMSPLNLIYDITPPELVTAVVTEVSILPCTSVPVILRIKPTEIGYYS